ncbi:Protein of unknown function [Ruminococcus sp. YE71]|uniref:DUF998 domain-containing protein n=1 Tax=unclassified Ruminococcus TaxID=2608920 RepID=UPI0008867C64|nr:MULTISPECIES: DUF998 domain-containing protein [unclassified Ruminococcus]SDA22959.1 Protein of unknown function [Ruminococcus sp. YE78]SFW39031.1 Protein of unknown function [Ruminococcus sp. YE71]
MDKKTLINYIGLLGVVSFLSYVAAVVFSPLAYPGYNWMAQAVSDLSAENSPSRMLWNQLDAPGNKCTLVCLMCVCIYIKDKLTRTLRVGIYLFTGMSWVSGIGYTMFPLSDSGNAGNFQDFMHIYVVTALVVLLSIASLIVMMVGGYRSKGKYRYIAIAATVALTMMFVGAIGKDAVPREYFGIVERFSVFAATGFTGFLGICLFTGFKPHGEEKLG